MQTVRQDVATAHMQTPMQSQMDPSGFPGLHEMLPGRVSGQPNNGQGKGDRGSRNENQTPISSQMSWLDHKNGI